MAKIAFLKTQTHNTFEPSIFIHSPFHISVP